MGKTLQDDLPNDDNNQSTSIVFSFEGHIYQDNTARLQVDKLTPEEVRHALNRAPSKYAFWGAMLAKVERMVGAKRAAYELWLATKQSKYSTTRMSETAKRYAVMVSYPNEYKTWQKAILELEEVRSKIAVLVKAYEIQSRTLQSVSGLLRAELESLD